MRYTRSSGGTELHQLVEIEHLGLVHHALDRDLPGLGDEPRRGGRDAFLVGGELVEIVVIADVSSGVIGSSTRNPLAMAAALPARAAVRHRGRVDRRRTGTIEPAVDPSGRHHAGRRDPGVHERAGG